MGIVNQDKIKVEYADELYDENLYYGEIWEGSFYELPNESFELKRLNVINKRVYSPDFLSEDIMEYINQYLKLPKLFKQGREFYYLEKGRITITSKINAMIFYIDSIFFSKKRSEKIMRFLKNNNIEILNCKIRFKVEDLGYKSLSILLLSLIWIILSFFTELKISKFPMYIFFFLALIMFFTSSSIASIKLKIKKEKNSKFTEDESLAQIIETIFLLDYVSNKAKRNIGKNFYLSISPRYSNIFMQKNFQESLANLLFQVLQENKNLYIIINNSSPIFLDKILKNYQDLYNDLTFQNYEYLFYEFQMIQLEEEQDEEVIGYELNENDCLEDDYLEECLPKIHAIEFPKSGNFNPTFQLIDRDTYIRNQAAKELEENNTRIVQFLSSELSHEIRNPLGVIQMSIENILLDNEFVNEEQRVTFLDVLKQIKRIDEVLDYFRKYSTGKNSGIRKLDINEIITESLDYLKEQLQFNSISIEFSRKELPLIHGVTEKIGNVFINLIRNSIDALKSQTVKRIRIDTYSNNTSVQIEFWDNGAGIPIENQSKIFSPFFTTKINGSGMGLSIAKRVIETEMNGKMWFKCEEGTVFYIHLPINWSVKDEIDK